MRCKTPFLFPAYALFIALLLGVAPRSVAEEAATPPAVAYGTASDRAIDTLPTSNFEMNLQSAAGGALPKILFGDSIRMIIKSSPISHFPDTLMAQVSCSESQDILKLLLVEDSAKAGTYLSRVIPIVRGSANADGNLDCLETDMLEARFNDPVYLDVKIFSVEIPAPISVHGRTRARAILPGARDGLLRGGVLAYRPPEGVACFDVRGVFQGWASPLGSGR